MQCEGKSAWIFDSSYVGRVKQRTSSDGKRSQPAYLSLECLFPFCSDRRSSFVVWPGSTSSQRILQVSRSSLLMKIAIGLSVSCKAYAPFWHYSHLSPVSLVSPSLVIVARIQPSPSGSSSFCHNSQDSVTLNTTI